MLWAMWRVGDSNAMMGAFDRSAQSVCGPSDALVYSMLLAINVWQGHGLVEYVLESWVSATLTPSILTNVVCCVLPATLMRSNDFSKSESANPFYQRLARLVDVTEDLPSTPQDVLRRIEAFGHVSSWLKVAGDEKAEVLADAIKRRPLHCHECTLELGAFVGYSAIRFAGQTSSIRKPRSLCGVSLEIDPVHVAVSRRHLAQAKLSNVAEVWVGQLQDTMPRVGEVLGERCLAFTFMDQRGTTFHEDLMLLERMPALAPISHVTADNTVKPGSPVFIWHVALGASRRFRTQLWSMPEFALVSIEDWQSVSLLLGDREQAHGCSSATVLNGRMEAIAQKSV